MSSTLIELKNVTTFTPDGQPLSEGLSFSLSPKDIMLVEGDNGSGKTTLAKAILGLHRQFKGQIHRRTDKIGYLPQMGNVQFFLPLNLNDTIALKSKASRKAILELGLMNEDSLERPWNSASGGERQKALLTRALIDRPDFLVLDEPLNHLDAPAREKASALIQQLALGGCAVLLISHLGSETPLNVSHKITLKRTEATE